MLSLFQAMQISEIVGKTCGEHKATGPFDTNHSRIRLMLATAAAVSGTGRHLEPIHAIAFQPDVPELVTHCVSGVRRLVQASFVIAPPALSTPSSHDVRDVPMSISYSHGLCLLHVKIPSRSVKLLNAMFG